MNKLARSSRSALFLLFSSSCATCGTPGGEACTEIGCADGFRLVLSPSSPWPAGAYRFEVHGDGGSPQVCTGSLPLPPCDAAPLSCTGPDLAIITASGCALPAAEHSFPELQLPSGPAQLRVVIERDGSKFFDRTFSPAYVISRPNGPNCDPECRTASETASVTF